MRRIAIAFLLACAASFPSSARAGGIPASLALAAVVQAKGDAILGNLLEIRGADGAPQPSQWTLSFKDDTARGGVREFVVNETGITGERTPLQPGDVATAAPMTSPVLEVDSTGAFAAANAEADKAMLGFYSLNYRLRDVGGMPVWSVELFDVDGNEVGSVGFSARDGAIVSPLRAAVAPPMGVTPAGTAMAPAPAMTPVQQAPATTPAQQAPASPAALWMQGMPAQSPPPAGPGTRHTP